MSDKPIRKYVDDYYKYYPDRWSWKLKDTIDQNELYKRTRARRSKGNSYKNEDKFPDFFSIERDADQFGLDYVEWTDIFGLIWIGERGDTSNVGAPDYEGSLYYYDPDESYDDTGYRISDKYNAYDNQPPKDVYTKIESRGITSWIDTANVVDVEYKYFVTNHLFKDTFIELIYEDGEKLAIYRDYKKVIKDLLAHEKNDLVKKIFKAMNEHFIKLRDHESEDVREFFPGKTAEEMFLK